VRSPDSSRQILRALGAEQHPRTSAPGHAARLPRHVPDLPAGELPLKLTSALTMPHGPSPPSMLSNTPIPRPRVPPPSALRSLSPTQEHDAPPAAADGDVLAEAYKNSSASSMCRARGERPILSHRRGLGPRRVSVGSVAAYSAYQS
jgi:hypothetical protein